MNSAFTTIYRHPDGTWHAPILDAEPWLEHCFGTALARPAGTWRELKQIHSACVVTSADWHDNLEADGLICAEPGTAIAVKSADCLPILLADTANRAVAAVHAGWRGCVAGIPSAAIALMQERFGSRPDELVAAFGPSIRSCCFEVGPEVAQQFARWFPERDDLDRRTHVDLPEASRRQMVLAGMRDERICSQAPCTVCGGGLAEPQEFHSWRRDRQTGARMLSLITVRA